MSIAVSIVESDGATRERWAQLLDRAEGFRCVSQHSDAAQAIEKAPGHHPGVVLTDLNLPGLGGMETMRRLKKLLPKSRFIMCAAYKDSDAILSALMAGADGYLLKQATPRELLTALREACAGGSLITSQIVLEAVETLRQTRITANEADGLTPREQEVLHLLAEGYLYKEIASQLQISYRTVSTHIEHIYGKLHVQSRTQAVAKHLRQA